MKLEQLTKQAITKNGETSKLTTLNRQGLNQVRGGGNLAYLGVYL